MRSLNIFHYLIVLGAVVLAATPAFAMKEPPKQPISSSGSSSGGTPVPEPSTLVLFGAGAAAFMGAKRRKQRG